ncbi:MAG: GHKL domain-containing protein [Spirochaetaceae bacterium]|jgi:two-component system, sporulation sensor kinase E|nr:GHKL domain-containing protein [Spirochaetaceae bacterium]
MRGFVRRVSQKISKLSPEQVEQLIDIINSENETLDAVIESLSTGLLICDVNWCLLQANKAAERYIPLKIRLADWRYNENRLEQNVWQIIDDADIASFIKNNAEREKNNSSEEFTIETSGGAKRFIVISTLPLVRERKLIGNIVKIDDVTDKKNQDTLLRRMENLASLTNLAASVAHEIKNPLGSISIHIQLIQKAVSKSRSSDQKLPDEKFIEKYLQVVNEEIERLNKIIVDFLFAVRPISASLELTDVVSLIKSFIPFFEPELEEQHISLETQLPDAAPKLNIDQKLFKQVLINLVQNAIAALNDGGRILLSAKTTNDFFVIRVADNGIGMDEETVHRVFEPYFTTKAAGTGLGLTMVYKIIKEFSGDITVQSYPGEGTIFTISLPIPQKEKRLLEYSAD